MGRTATRVLLNQSAQNLAVRAAGVVAALLSTVVLARTLGAEQFGAYAWALALITMLAVPAQLGLPELVVRETAKAKGLEKWGLMRGVWGWSSGAAIISSGIIACICAATLLLLGQWGWTPLAVGLIFIPLGALANIRGAALRGLGQVVPGLFPMQVLRPAVGIVVVLAWSIVADLDAAGSMIIFVASSGVALLASTYLLRRFRPQEARVAKPERHNLAWAGSTVTFALVAGMTVVLQQTDIVMLGAISGMEDAGLYRVSVQGALLVSFGLTATISAISPHFARAHAVNDMAELRRLVIFSSRLTVALAIIPVVVLVGFGQDLIILVFGAPYAAAIYPLLILALGQLAIAVVGPVSVLLAMTGHERDSAMVMAIAMVLNVALNTLLIPRFGPIGAAAATATSVAVQHTLLIWRVHARLGFVSWALSRAS
jgi:O-antigen/teichoic acid export membrane protein